MTRCEVALCTIWCVTGSVCLDDREYCWWRSYMSWNAVCTRRCNIVSKFIKGMHNLEFWKMLIIVF